jgi:hypothetical protein
VSTRCSTLSTRTTIDFKTHQGPAAASNAAIAIAGPPIDSAIAHQRAAQAHQVLQINVNPRRLRWTGGLVRTQDDRQQNGKSEASIRILAEACVRFEPFGPGAEIQVLAFTVSAGIHRSQTPTRKRMKGPWPTLAGYPSDPLEPPAGLFGCRLRINASLYG